MTTKTFTDLHFDTDGERTTGYNSTYKKLAVQWLNEALCFVSSSVVADSFRLRNRQLLVAAKRYAQFQDDTQTDNVLTMKNAFKKTFKIFKYLAIIFTVVFWIYMIYDDFIFIEKYGLRLEYIGLWFIWYFIYFLGFAFYFWVIASVIILVYHKVVKRTKLT